MGEKIDPHLYKYYFKKIKEFRQTIKTIEEREGNALLSIKQDPSASAYQQLALAEDMLHLASNYLVLNNTALFLLHSKSYAALEAGRKAVFRSIGYLEGLVTGYVDAPFSAFESSLRKLEAVNSERRYDLIRKMGLAIRLLENAYEGQDKWKWAFVELDGRFAAVAKNIFDLRNAVANTGPRSPHYAATVNHLRLIKKLLVQAADLYRTRYEVFSHELTDCKKGIDFLEALRRIHALLGERGEAADVKKKIDIWSAKMEFDLQGRESVLHGS
jgi:hypothetical protein